MFIFFLFFLFFFFNDTATTEIYTLSLHDALPICIYDLIVGSAKSVDKSMYPVDGVGAVTTRAQAAARKKPMSPLKIKEITDKIGRAHV